MLFDLSQVHKPSHELFRHVSRAMTRSKRYAAGYSDMENNLKDWVELRSSATRLTTPGLIDNMALLFATAARNQAMRLTDIHLRKFPWEVIGNPQPQDINIRMEDFKSNASWAGLSVFEALDILNAPFPFVRLDRYSDIRPTVTRDARSTTIRSVPLKFAHG